MAAKFQKSMATNALETSGSRGNVFDKTELCRFFAKGKCKQGSTCRFAHGAGDIAPRPNFYKTHLCIDFFRNFCPFGESCRFAHSAEEVRQTSQESTANREDVPSRRRRRRRLQQVQQLQEDEHEKYVEWQASAQRHVQLESQSQQHPQGSPHPRLQLLQHGWSKQHDDLASGSLLESRLDRPHSQQQCQQVHATPDANLQQGGKAAALEAMQWRIVELGPLLQALHPAFRRPQIESGGVHNQQSSQGGLGVESPLCSTSCEQLSCSDLISDSDRESADVHTFEDEEALSPRSEDDDLKNEAEEEQSEGEEEAFEVVISVQRTFLSVVPVLDSQASLARRRAHSAPPTGRR